MLGDIGSSSKIFSAPSRNGKPFFKTSGNNEVDCFYPSSIISSGEIKCYYYGNEKGYTGGNDNSSPYAKTKYYEESYRLHLAQFIINANDVEFASNSALDIIIPVTTDISEDAVISVDEEIYFFGLSSGMLSVLTTNGATKRTSPSSSVDKFDKFSPYLDTSNIPSAEDANHFGFE